MKIKEGQSHLLREEVRSLEAKLRRTNPGGIEKKLGETKLALDQYIEAYTQKDVELAKAKEKISPGKIVGKQSTGKALRLPPY